MDMLTLTVVTCLTAATMAIAMGAMARFSPSDACLRDWACAGLLFLGNGLLGLVAVSLPLPSWVVVLANACTIAGYLFVWSGLRLYLGHPPAHRWVGVVTATVALLNLLPAVGASLTLRLLVGWPVIAATCYATVGLVLRTPRHRRSPALTVMAVWMALYGSQQAVRVILLLQAVLTGQPMDWNSVLMTAGRLLFFLFILLTAMLCALLVIQDKAAALKRSADVDPMTGWFNRRAMGRMLGAELARARRQGSGLHLLVFDIDHFKRINDQHGHAVGDAAICHVTCLVAQELRDYDLRFRIGGEEFVVGVPSAQALMLAERLRARVAGSPLLMGELQVPITVSVGCGEAGPTDTTWEALLQRADAALYQAKRGGRNRVAQAPRPDPGSELVAV